MNDPRPNAQLTTPPPPPGHPSGLDAEHYRDPTRWLPRLRRLIDDQTDLALSLEHLSSIQSEAVNRGDVATTLDVLAQREPLVERMTAISRELEPFLSQPGSVGGGGSPSPASRLQGELRSDLERRLSRLTDVMNRVNERDREDRARLESLRQHVADELASVATSKGAMSAYGSRSGVQSPSFQDRSA